MQYHPHAHTCQPNTREQFWVLAKFNKNLSVWMGIRKVIDQVNANAAA